MGLLAGQAGHFSIQSLTRPARRSIKWDKGARIWPKFAQYILCEPKILRIVLKLGGWQGFQLQFVLFAADVCQLRTSGTWDGQ